MLNSHSSAYESALERRIDELEREFRELQQESRKAWHDEHMRRLHAEADLWMKVFMFVVAAVVVFVWLKALSGK